MENQITLLGLSITISVLILLTVVFYNITIKKKQGGNKITGDENNQTTGDGNTTVVNNGTINQFAPLPNTPDESVKNKEITNEDIKDKIHILFVDDKDDFKIIEMLKNNKYNVEYLSDISDIDCKEVRTSNIIFMDINGVGAAMKFKNQGMGLCGAIKDRYPGKKVILYSAETPGDIFDKDAKKADATLQKDSDLYQFISYITQYGKEILAKTC